MRFRRLRPSPLDAPPSPRSPRRRLARVPCLLSLLWLTSSAGAPAAAETKKDGPRAAGSAESDATVTTGPAPAPPEVKTTAAILSEDLGFSPEEVKQAEK